ncbi:AAA family ATPase [Streptomyces melanosporofaciens]
MNAVLTTEDGGPLVVSVYVIAGTAGAGKTSLALRWAHQVRERFPDGQLFANLRGYDPGEPVAAREALHRLLTSLGVPAGAVPQDLDAAAALYRSLLADRRVLVVLDNAATVGQVRPLLPGSAHSLVLVTSRSPCPASPSATGPVGSRLACCRSRRRLPCCASSPRDTGRSMTNGSSPNWPGCAHDFRSLCG